MKHSAADALSRRLSTPAEVADIDDENIVDDTIDADLFVEGEGFGSSTATFCVQSYPTAVDKGVEDNSKVLDHF